MPKMPVMTSDKIIKLLKKKGFVLDRQKGSHKIFYHPEMKIRVVVPYHRRDLPKGTQKEILKQAKIDPDELR